MTTINIDCKASEWATTHIKQLKASGTACTYKTANGKTNIVIK